VKILWVFLIACLLAAGCSTPPEPPAVTTFPTERDVPAQVPALIPVVTAERIESEKILITYLGAPDADQLFELETTVVTGRGSVHIQSMGSRLDTTPVRIGGTDIFQGPYTGPVHVVIAGYYANGTHRDFLDTSI
jgi:hypothetical protein